MKRMPRKQQRKQIATLTKAASAIALTLGTAAVAAQSLTVVSWGGAYTRSQVKAYHEPWEERTGIKINSIDYNGGLAEVKAQVESGNVTWDLVDLELSDVIRGCDEGLLEPLDADSLPSAPDGTAASDDFIDGTLYECGIAQIVWSTIYAYDADKMTGDQPTKLTDFFDTAKFPGKRGLRKSPKVNLEWALMADGVPGEQVYEVLGTDEGVDRAFAKLDTIKSDIVWWEAGAQPPQLLADGEVTLTTAYNGRIFNAQAKEKKNFAIVWDGQVWDLDLWGIPKGSPNLDSAMEFVRFSTDTVRNADQARWISYGPVRKSAMELLAGMTYAEAPDVQMLPNMPTQATNLATAIQNDFEFWADKTDELNERFNTWLSQ